MRGRLALLVLLLCVSRISCSEDARTLRERLSRCERALAEADERRGYVDRVCTWVTNPKAGAKTELKKTVHNFLRATHLDSAPLSSGARTAHLVVHMSEDDLVALRRFLLVDDGDETRIQDILRDSISLDRQGPAPSWHWPVLGADDAVHLLVILFFVGVGWMLWSRVAVWKVITLLLMCSVAWTWTHMYKKALAKKQAALFRLGHVPATCLVEKQGWLAAMTDAVASFVGHKNNQCEDYYEALLVDPTWEVTPLAAVSETMSQFVLSPLRALGHFLGLFFGEVLAPIPLVWKIPVLVVVVILIAFVLLMAFRYKISSPLLLRIEPSHSDEKSKASSCLPSSKKEALPYPTGETQLDRLFPPHAR